MSDISSKKTEQRAITIINQFINDISSADSNILKNDKSISWDGTIDFYAGNIDKKDNYEFSIDVQVKGRTSYNKRLMNKASYDLSIIDLKNYLKKDGTILFLVLFKKDSVATKVYYRCLLPYDINKLLKENSNSKSVKIKMKEVVSSKDLETICRNFQINKDVQKKMTLEMFNQSNLYFNNEMTVGFSIWDNSLISPADLVGTEQYVYVFDEMKSPKGIDKVIIKDYVKKIENVVIKDYENQIIYDELNMSISVKSEKITFGKAFAFDLQKNTFNARINGTFKERLKQLKFLNKAFEHCGFFINNDFYEFKEKIPSELLELIKKYLKLENFFEDYHIKKDFNFDNWTDSDFKKLDIWIDAIKNGKITNLNIVGNLMGSLPINDFKLSILVLKMKNGELIVESIWNSKKIDKYAFKYSNGEYEIKTNNLYLILNKEAYLADDFNINNMLGFFDKYDLKKEDYTLLNLQVLEILKAYDINKNNELLIYAKYLLDILMNQDCEFKDIYFINYCQVLKRENKLTEKEMNKLLDIRNNNDLIEIKLSCNLLLNNKNEVNLLLKNMKNEQLEEFKEYPIAIYFNKD